MAKSRRKAFIAHKFTGFINNSGQVDNRIVQRIISVESLLHENGYETSNPMRREEWGKDLLPSDISTPMYLEGIKESDLVVAFPYDSGSVHIELGWATVLHKPVILLLDKKCSFSPLVHGLRKIAPVKVVEYANEDEIVRKLDKALKEIELRSSS